MNVHFLERAIELSEENVRAGRGGPFGAVIARDGVIIAEGTNSVPVSNDPTAHAEIAAIREACRRLKRFHLEDCEIHTSCEPCPMCLGAIYWARLGRLVFAASREDAASAGFDDSVLYREVALPPEQRRLPCRQALRERAIHAFEQWNRKPDRVSY